LAYRTPKEIVEVLYWTQHSTPEVEIEMYNGEEIKAGEERIRDLGTAK
jgi:hypothetical protein